MASLEKLFDEKGRVRAYKVRWRTNTGGERSKTFLRKADADRAALKVEIDKQVGDELDSHGDRLTVGQYIDEWRAVQAHREGTVARVDNALILFRGMLGGHPIRRVRQSEIKGWLKARGEEVGPSTLRSDWRWVCSLFRAAVADNLISRSPCEGIKVDAPQRRRMAIPPREAIETICAGLPDAWAFLPILGARTGLRPAELLGLCAEQIDWLRMEMTVDRQMLRGRVILQTKTHSSHRTVPLDPDTVRELSVHLAFQPLGPPFELTDGRGQPAGEGRLVFHRPDGSPISHRAVDDTWRRRAIATGCGSLRLHDMRHFFASTQLLAGASANEVAELVGHSRASITVDLYGHAPENAHARARQRAAEIWAVS